MVEEIKKKKKKWYTILASNEFNNAEIGETLTFDAKDMMGKNVEANLANLINDIKKQNVKIVFKIINAAGDKLNTKFVSYNLLPSYIRRVVRRDKEKIEDSFICLTKDNVKIRLKTLMITKDRTKHTILTKIRRESREVVTEEIKKLDFLDVLKDIAMNKFQRSLKDHIKKIYPLGICDIKNLIVI